MSGTWVSGAAGPRGDRTLACQSAALSHLGSGRSRSPSPLPDGCATVARRRNRAPARRVAQLLAAVTVTRLDARAHAARADAARDWESAAGIVSLRVNPPCTR